MKFSIEQPDLVAAMASARSIVKSANTIPILGNVLLSVHDDKLHIASTDLDMRVDVTAECNVEADGKTTVSAIKLFDISRNLSSQKPINVELDGDTLVVKQGRARFKLETLPADKFALPMKISDPKEISVNSLNLCNAIKITEHAVSDNEVQYSLNGIYFHVDDGDINIVATDGHRLARTKIGGEFDFQPFILPSKTALILTKLLAIKENEISVTVGTNCVKFEIGDTILYSRLIDAKFPLYKNTIPETCGEVLTGKEEFLSALKKVVLLSSDRTKEVVLLFENNIITMNNIANGNEQATDHIDCEFSGSIKFAFNSNYLFDAVSKLEDGIFSILIGETGMTPVIIRKNDTSEFVIGPVKPKF